MTEQSSNGASSEPPGAERNDAVLEETDRSAEQWGESIGRWIARTAARAREDAEDIWAEAQALRRKL